MVRKKKIILVLGVILIIILSTVIAIIYRFKNTPEPIPYYEMPVMPFVYRTGDNNLYVFDCDGNIYKISRMLEIAKGFVWEKPIVQCLEAGEALEGLEKVGTVDSEILQEKYNLFRDIAKNPEYCIFPTTNTAPVDEDSFFPPTTELWYGYLNGTEQVGIFYTAYMEYDVTDDRAYEIVDWMNEEVAKCTDNDWGWFY